MDAKPFDLADPAAYRFWIEDHVRFADLDPLGHCNHTVISGFFESARVALFEAVGYPVVGGRTTFPIVRLLLEFRRELLCGARVRVGTRVAKLGRTSIGLAGGVFEGERCAATAEVVGVVIDLATRAPVELPAELRERLSAHL